MILPTDTNDGALFLPLTNDEALFLPLTLMMGHYSSHTDTNDGAPSPSLEYHTEIAYHIEIKSAVFS
ncbi:unnamed protein product, partial [Staurois parvus]